MAIYVVFYKGRKRDNPDTTFFDRLVCFVTRGKYSHVELGYRYTRENNVLLCWSSSPRDGGVRSTAIKLDPVHWDLFEYTGPLPSWMAESTETEIHKWFEPKNGLKYDWFGAIGTKFKLFYHEVLKYFCSEILAEFFQFKRPHRQTPKSLFNLMKNNLVQIKL